jgi:guanosine-3',5'-bis(diphosphate) 3'-pyrophosphohydrolase
MEIQTLYQKAIQFATTKLLVQRQLVPGTELPYVVHLSNVAMEILVAGSQTEKFDLGFAMQVALLHDTLEDTATTFEELVFRFGSAIAEAVAAFSKNGGLPNAQQMVDSLARIEKINLEAFVKKL